jgi:flagellar basal-body rod modification protein FlgD
MSTISAISNSGSDFNTGTSVIPEKTLTQKDFFKLLIAQLSAQDPMNPMSNAEFMGQMAQFSTLEQTRTLEASVSNMRTEQQMLQANSLIGRDVGLQVGDDIVQGTVIGVQLENGIPKVVVDGMAYGLNQVIAITQSASTLY